MGKQGTKIAGAGVKELIHDLNRAYADEWFAYFAYSHMAEVVTGKGYEDMSEFFEDTAKEEREHIGEIANRILELGGTPTPSPAALKGNAPYPQPPKSTDDYDAMIKVVLDAEAGAIDVYQKICAKTFGKDHVTYALISHILSEEVRHEETFEDLL